MSDWLIMRNDAHDEINDLPSLNAARYESQQHTNSDNDAATYTAQANPDTYNNAPQSNKAVGILSTLTFALLCASASFAWWSMQRIQLLEQQLVATQDSFSRISEDANGRIKDITGKFTATESSVLGDNEILKMRLNKIESAAVEATKQQQVGLTEQAASLNTLSRQLASLKEASDRIQTVTEQQQQAAEQQKNNLNTLQADLKTRFEQYTQQLNQLQTSTDNHQQKMAQLTGYDIELKKLATQIGKIQQNSVSSDDITRLQQDILILRSELEQRPTLAPASTQGPSIADFDAYRAQTNRTISTLQEQVSNLQKNAP